MDLWAFWFAVTLFLFGMTILFFASDDTFDQDRTVQDKLFIALGVACVIFGLVIAGIAVFCF